MIKHGFEGTNCEDFVKDKLPQLIEYYVKFYGEEKRQIITDRLNHTIFIFAENQSEKYADEINKRFDNLIKQDEVSGGENKEYLEKERDRILKQFMSARPRRYRRELEKNCLNFITYYLKEMFGFADNQIDEVRNLAKDYIPLIKLGRNSYFKIYENNEEKKQFNNLISSLAKLKGVDQSKPYPNEFANAVKNIASIKKINAVKSQLKNFIDDYNEKMSLVVRDTIKDVVKSGVAYEDDIIEEIEKYIRIDDGLLALTTVSINLDNPVYPVCVCCNNELLMLDDRSFMHEVNHAVTSHAGYDNDFFHTKSGITEFVYYVFNMDMIKRVDDDERYTALDEIINDYLSQKIYNIAKDDGFVLGGNEEIESLYSAAFPLFENFLENHLSEIKEIVLSEDGSAMENFLGLKNVVKLADLATEMLNFCNKNVCDKNYRETVGMIGGEREVDFFKLAKRKDELIFSPYKKYLSFYSRGEKIFKEIDACLNKKQKTSKKKEIKVEDEKPKQLDEKGE